MARGYPGVGQHYRPRGLVGHIVELLDWAVPVLGAEQRLARAPEGRGLRRLNGGVLVVVQGQHPRLG